jgi:hypothetical protein
MTPWFWLLAIAIPAEQLIVQRVEVPAFVIHSSQCQLTAGFLRGRKASVGITTASELRNYWHV